MDKFVNFQFWKFNPRVLPSRGGIILPTAKMKCDLFCDIFILLQMKVTGNNLTNICMVVYRVAKTEKNDQLFLEEDILSKINSLLPTVSCMGFLKPCRTDRVKVSLRLTLFGEGLKVTC